MNVFPRVVEQNKGIKYTLILDNVNNMKNIESIYVFSKTDYFHNEKISFTVEKEVVSFEYKMKYLGEFTIKVNFNYDESKFINLFCIDKELKKLTPLKGDLHMHSIYSDGKRTPFAMALSSLEAGMDFISVTDHDNYDGCQEAIKKVNDYSIDLIVLPGEEISVGQGDTKFSKGNGHMLSINAKNSIEEQRNDKKVYEKELERITEKLEKKGLDENINSYHYAKNIWAINKVHEADGIAILCHPNWIYTNKKFHLHQAIFKEVLKNSDIDGVEVFGDVDKVEECNNLTYLSFSQNKNKNKKLALLANSDAHDSNHDLGLRFTVVFVKEKNINGVAEALKKARTCAVYEKVKEGYHVLGDEFLASYTFFLLREYFPKHQKLRFKLARLYIDEFINGFDFRSKIEITKSKLLRHRKSFFSN